jgi:hypothetical protein
LAQQRLTKMVTGTMFQQPSAAELGIEICWLSNADRGPVPCMRDDEWRIRHWCPAA